VCTTPSGVVKVTVTPSMSQPGAAGSVLPVRTL
jgi:hypothetical protein